MKSISKGRSVGLLIVVILGSFVMSGQPWYEVTMSPNDENVLLKSFDGYTAYAWLSPILLVCLAAAAVAALVVGFGARIVMGFGFLVSCVTAFLVAKAVTNQDLAGVTKQLESATGIAATHGITGLGIQTTSFAYLSLVLVCLVAVAFLFSLVAQPSWVISASSVKVQKATSSLCSNPQVEKPARAKSAPKDSIALWDEQR